METTLQKAVFACSKAILQLYALKMVIVREEPRAKSLLPSPYPYDEEQ